MVVVFHQLRDAAQYVTKMIANAGFSARVESVNAVEAYLGSMPGNLFANVRRPLVNTLNLAHLLPLTAIWAGPEVHPCPFYPEHSAPLLQAKTDGATPYRLSLHAGDLGHGHHWPDRLGKVHPAGNAGGAAFSLFQSASLCL